MENWEYELRSDIFNAFLANNKQAANSLIAKLMVEKNIGFFYRYRDLNMAEISTIRFDQLYLCRAIRFGNKKPNDIAMFKSYVACFTDRRFSLSMWSEYANNAKGICLEYSADDLAQFATDNDMFFSPVRYADNPLDISSKYSSVMTMMSKPKYESNEYEWRLWKVDMHSNDIGKLVSSISPRKIYVGRNADRESDLFDELVNVADEKEIDLIL
ncbi:Protein of unknown function [Lachnospiraceae bacterium KH1T2]|nr:Protein of unknown function [Lachnospiraceae bacterium KH1T2]